MFKYDPQAFSSHKHCYQGAVIHNVQLDNVHR